MTVLYRESTISNQVLKTYLSFRLDRDQCGLICEKKWTAPTSKSFHPVATVRESRILYPLKQTHSHDLYQAGNYGAP